MKLLFIQDLNPFTETGGAQLNDKSKIVEGLKRGHDINIMLPPGDKSQIDRADAVIISNCTAFSVDIFRDLLDKKKPYLFFLHDYTPICKVRLFFPMLTKCKSCYRRDTWLEILQESKLLIFLSKLHRDAWLFTCPELRQNKYLLNPSTIDCSQFYDLKQERSGSIAVNSGLDFKGRKVLVEYAEAHPEEQIALVGPVDGPLADNIVLRDAVPYDQMNELYNAYKTFIHLPENPMPFDRTPVEAKLSGCKVIGNKNVGALSWKFMHHGREEIERAMSKANKDFWVAVERALA
jgi:glycosyltransferase involved in cell wall biosynthesis